MGGNVILTNSKFHRSPREFDLRSHLPNEIRAAIFCNPTLLIGLGRYIGGTEITDGSQRRFKNASYVCLRLEVYLRSLLQI